MVLKTSVHQFVNQRALPFLANEDLFLLLLLLFIVCTLHHVCVRLKMLLRRMLLSEHRSLRGISHLISTRQKPPCGDRIASKKRLPLRTAVINDENAKTSVVSNSYWQASSKASVTVRGYRSKCMRLMSSNGIQSLMHNLLFLYIYIYFFIVSAWVFNFNMSEPKKELIPSLVHIWRHVVLDY